MERGSFFFPFLEHTYTDRERKRKRDMEWNGMGCSGFLSVTGVHVWKGESGLGVLVWFKVGSGVYRRWVSLGISLVLFC
jgi:hypothetical protein